MDSLLLRNRPAYTLDRSTAPAMWLVGCLWLIQATGVQTGNRCSFLEQVMPEGLGPPAHFHPLAIEGFYVVEGTITFHVDGKTLRAEAGTIIHLPRMIPHTFTIDSETTRVLNWYAPAGNELHVISLARGAEERRLPTFEESPPPKNDELNQIISRLYGSVGVTALPFSVPPSEELLKTPANSWHVGSLAIARREDGIPFEAFGMTWTLLVSGAATQDIYDVLDVAVPTGASMPDRILGADEALYILEGAVDLVMDGKRSTAGPGAFTYAPAGTSLRWQASEMTRLLVFHFPGGFDRALSSARGEEDLVKGWMEAEGTRFI